jgi:hypothetical protein
MGLYKRDPIENVRLFFNLFQKNRKEPIRRIGLLFRLKDMTEYAMIKMEATESDVMCLVHEYSSKYKIAWIGYVFWHDVYNGSIFRFQKRELRKHYQDNLLYTFETDTVKIVTHLSKRDGFSMRTINVILLTNKNNLDWMYTQPEPKNKFFNIFKAADILDKNLNYTEQQLGNYSWKNMIDWDKVSECGGDIDDVSAILNIQCGAPVYCDHEIRRCGDSFSLCEYVSLSWKEIERQEFYKHGSHSYDNNKRITIVWEDTEGHGKTFYFTDTSNGYVSIFEDLKERTFAMVSCIGGHPYVVSCHRFIYTASDGSTSEELNGVNILPKLTIKSLKKRKILPDSFEAIETSPNDIIKALEQAARIYLSAWGEGSSNESSSIDNSSSSNDYE